MNNKKWWLIGIGVAMMTMATMYLLDSYFRDFDAIEYLKSKNKNFKKFQGIEKSSSMGYGYSTILCEYKINGMTVLLPYSVMRNIEKGELNRTLHHAFSGANLFYDYGKNSLSIKVMSPPHMPRDGTYFFCDASPENEAVRISITPKNNPYLGQKKQIVYTDQERAILEKEMDYAAPSWHIEKLRGNPDNLDIIEHETSTYTYGILPDLTVSLDFNYDPQNSRKKEPVIWRDTLPFEDTPDNRALLWQAYEELIEAFESQDEKRLFKLLEMAVGQSELMTGNLNNMILTEHLVSKVRSNWRNYGFIKGEVNRDEYVLDIADHGKLFRFVKADHRIFQPVHFKLPDGGSYIYTLYFTLIEGKPTVAFIHNASF